jgi:hypothetical protein
MHILKATYDADHNKQNHCEKFNNYLSEKRALGKIQNIVLNIFLGLSLLLSVLYFDQIVLKIIKIFDRCFKETNNSFTGPGAVIHLLVIHLIYFTTIGLYFNRWYFCVASLIFMIVFGGIIVYFKVFNFSISQKIRGSTIIFKTIVSIHFLTILALCLLKWIPIHLFQKINQNNWVVFSLLIVFAVVHCLFMSISLDANIKTKIFT